MIKYHTIIFFSEIIKRRNWHRNWNQRSANCRFDYFPFNKYLINIFQKKKFLFRINKIYVYDFIIIFFFFVNSYFSKKTNNEVEGNNDATIHFILKSVNFLRFVFRLFQLYEIFQKKRMKKEKKNKPRFWEKLKIITGRSNGFSRVTR